MNQTKTEKNRIDRKSKRYYLNAIENNTFLILKTTFIDNCIKITEKAPYESRFGYSEENIYKNFRNTLDLIYKDLPVRSYTTWDKLFNKLNLEEGKISERKGVSQKINYLVDTNTYIVKNAFSMGQKTVPLDKIHQFSIKKGSLSVFILKPDRVVKLQEGRFSIEDRYLYCSKKPFSAPEVINLGPGFTYIIISNTYCIYTFNILDAQLYTIEQESENNMPEQNVPRNECVENEEIFPDDIIRDFFQDFGSNEIVPECEEILNGVPEEISNEISDEILLPEDEIVFPEKSGKVVTEELSDELNIPEQIVHKRKSLTQNTTEYEVSLPSTSNACISFTSNACISSTSNVEHTNSSKDLREKKKRERSQHPHNEPTIFLNMFNDNNDLVPQRAKRPKLKTNEFIGKILKTEQDDSLEENERILSGEESNIEKFIDCEHVEEHDIIIAMRDGVDKCLELMKSSLNVSQITMLKILTEFNVGSHPEDNSTAKINKLLQILELIRNITYKTTNMIQDIQSLQRIIQDVEQDSITPPAAIAD